MTPAEAIEHEIDRERSELRRREKEIDRLQEETLKGNSVEALRRLIDLIGKELGRDEEEEEIRGKQEALEAVRENPDSPVEAIGEIIAAEVDLARKIGRRAQRLREEAWRAERSGADAEAERLREEAGKLGEQHKLQLARLRGKHISLREVERVLENRQ